jgi:hypothetical protein
MKKGNLTHLEKRWLYQTKQATKHTLGLARLRQYKQPNKHTLGLARLRQYRQPNNQRLAW